MSKHHLLFVLGEEHVGRTTITFPPCTHCGHVRRVHLGDVLGRVQQADVGKRVYIVGDIIQVENDEQRDKRNKENE